MLSGKVGRARKDRQAERTEEGPEYLCLSCQIRQPQEMADQTVRKMLVRGQMAMRDMVGTLDATGIFGLRRRMMMEQRQEKGRKNDSQQENGIYLSFAHHHKNRKRIYYICTNLTFHGRRKDHFLDERRGKSPAP